MNHERPNEAPPTRTTQRLAQVDGLRGLALLGMLAWHAQVTWVKGGFARMTIFFVLSGYLAFTAFQRERTTSSSPLRTYWIRRVRRLMPVTLIGVALALGVTALVGSTAARQSAGWDTVATLTSWINWRFIAAQQRYADLFARPTAFEHFWSLSLEEQCFLLTPVLALFAAWVGNKRAGIALLGISAAISAIPIFWKQSPDVVYYGTHVRFGEFAAGAALAVLVPLTSTQRAERTTSIIRWAAPLSLASLIVVMLTVPRDLGWLYRGGLGLMIVPALGILAGVVTGERVTTRALSIPPLAMLGRAALSIYAIHWPIYVLISEGIPQVHGATRQILQLTVSIAAGLGLYRWFEQPLMRVSRWNGSTANGTRTTTSGRVAAATGWAWSSPRRTLVAVAGVAVVLVAAAWRLPGGQAGVTFEQAIAEQEALSAASAAELGSGQQSDAPRFGVFGGSAAVMLWLTGDPWLQAHKDQINTVGGDAQLGCGLMLDGIRYSIGAPVEQNATNGLLGGFAMGPVEPPCREQPTVWVSRITTLKITEAVYISSTWDIGTWIFDQERGDSLVPGDPEYDQRLTDAMELRFDSMRAAGLERLFVTNLNRARPSMSESESNEWERRSSSYDSILASVAATRPWMVLIDQKAYSRSLSDDEFEALYPDGIHVADGRGGKVWDELIGPAVLAA